MNSNHLINISAVAFQSTKVTFSGHESFSCRQFWLKKGVDFVNAGKSFADPEAVVYLGVGKNMVSSIQSWMKSFGLLDDNQVLAPLANYLLGKNSRDPFLEDAASIWLLHYHLVTTKRAAIYDLVFNEFRKERIEFSRQQLIDFLRRKCLEWEINMSAATLQRDVDTFIKTYLQPAGKSQQIEDDFSTLLTDLNLLTQLGPARMQGGPLYKIESRHHSSLPVEILLYTCLAANPGLSLSFTRLLNAPNNPGTVFAMTANSLLAKLHEAVEKFEWITFTDDAGVRELQFRQRPDLLKLLDGYYCAT